ncbi:ProQ/FINO family protein [Acidovorax sp. NCPPB 3576]|uniref:ProQ/FINO family protein n=1 Tax=Acidovorax sp. NCPPB 3576 TaxID=2940488 RepID=UPI0023493977|nr:ProQ/FINO family protein [Acidovorax sp. NCPPB 3576]WCM88139.1 ProQ/FINO family protein [Acidovorax sp. NCPPB 3576]
MTDSVTAQEQQNNVPAPAPTAPAAADAAAAVASPTADGPQAGEGPHEGAARTDRPASRRGGRNRRKPGGAPVAEGAAPVAQAAPQNHKGAGPQGPRRTHPALEQLAALYPHLFGAQFLPLKRGIFQDLQAAHPDLFERDALKLALGIHTRSTRYLQVVAEGRQRHDLQGHAVEAMAPEHVHHALLEVFRRRKPRDGEDMTAKLRRRIAQAYEASGLTREAYDALVRGRDEAANALLDEAFAEVAERDAKAEALLRAFEASGSTVAQFADMYGMDPRTAERSLHRARQLRAAPVSAAAEPAADAPSEPPAEPAA